MALFRLKKNAVFLVCYVLTSCGLLDEEKPQFIKARYTPFPGLYFPLENTCGRSNREAPISAKLFGFGLQKSQWELSGKTGLNSDYFQLSKNPYIKSAVYHPRYQRVCRGGTPHASAQEECLNSQGVANFSYVVLSKGRKINLCGADLNYSRNSADSAYINSIYHISYVAKKIHELLGRQLSPINLEILPEYRSVYPARIIDPSLEGAAAFYEVSNMFYSPTYKQIVVLPVTESKVFPNYLNSDLYLWESAFALAHEYGHHIEHQLFYNNSNTGNRSWLPLRHRWFSDTQNISDDEQKNYINKDKFYSAISESLADLFAYYLLDEKAKEINKLVGVFESRSIENSQIDKFGVKIDKILNEENIKKFFENQAPVADPHDFSGIISHYINSIFDELDDELVSLGHKERYKSDKRLRLLIKFLDKFAERDDDIYTPEVDFINDLNKAVAKHVYLEFSDQLTAENVMRLMCRLESYSKQKAPNFKPIFANTCQ